MPTDRYSYRKLLIMALRLSTSIWAALSGKIISGMAQVRTMITAGIKMAQSTSGWLFLLLTWLLIENYCY
jgi:hypothetical protein